MTCFGTDMLFIYIFLPPTSHSIPSVEMRISLIIEDINGDDGGIVVLDGFLLQPYVSRLAGFFSLELRETNKLRDKCDLLMVH